MDRRHFIRTTAGGIVAAAAIGSMGAWALGFDPDRVTVQMLSRFGYAPATQPSPRRGVDAIVRP